MYIVGVYFCQVVSDHLMSAPENLVAAAELQQYYGSLPDAVVSLYQAITGGLNWRMIVAPLQDNISPWLAIPVCAYVAFALLAVLNIITGVFVENAMKSAKKDDDTYLLTLSRQLFLDICNEEGEITWETFQDQLSNPSLQNYFKAIDLSIEEADFLFTLIDIDESGGLTPDEFVNGCLRLRGNARALDQAILMREVVNSQRQLTAVSMALIYVTQQNQEQLDLAQGVEEGNDNDETSDAESDHSLASSSGLGSQKSSIRASSKKRRASAPKDTHRQVIADLERTIPAHGHLQKVRCSIRIPDANSSPMMTPSRCSSECGETSSQDLGQVPDDSAPKEACNKKLQKSNTRSMKDQIADTLESAVPAHGRTKSSGWNKAKADSAPM
jgi:hypothetical protein